MLFWFENCTAASPGGSAGVTRSCRVGSTNLSISSQYHRVMPSTSISLCTYSSPKGRAINPLHHSRDADHPDRIGPIAVHTSTAVCT